MLIYEIITVPMVSYCKVYCLNKIYERQYFATFIASALYHTRIVDGLFIQVHLQATIGSGKENTKTYSAT